MVAHWSAILALNFPLATFQLLVAAQQLFTREPFTLISSPYTTFKSFEMTTVTLKLPHSELSLSNIRRPPYSSAKSWDTASFSQFLDDSQTLISAISTSPHDFLLTGDLNIHVDDLTYSNTLHLSLFWILPTQLNMSFFLHTVLITLLTLSLLELILLFVLLYLNVRSRLRIIFLSITLWTFRDHPPHRSLSTWREQFILSMLKGLFVILFHHVSSLILLLIYLISLTATTLH